MDFYSLSPEMQRWVMQDTELQLHLHGMWANKVSTQAAKGPLGWLTWANRFIPDVVDTESVDVVEDIVQEIWDMHRQLNQNPFEQHKSDYMDMGRNYNAREDGEYVRYIKHLPSNTMITSAPSIDSVLGRKKLDETMRQDPRCTRTLPFSRDLTFWHQKTSIYYGDSNLYFYKVNVGGHLFEITGNPTIGFWWTNSEANKCLTAWVKEHARIYMLNLGDRKVFAFDNDGNGDCGILAILLYLCAKRIHLTNEKLRQLLHQHVHENLHKPCFLNDNDPSVAQKMASYYKVKPEATYFRCSMNYTEDWHIANARSGMGCYHLQAVSDVLGVCISLYLAEEVSSDKKEPRATDGIPVDAYVKRLTQPKHYVTIKPKHVTDVSSCRYPMQWLSMDFDAKAAGHAVLLGEIEDRIERKDASFDIIMRYVSTMPGPSLRTRRALILDTYATIKEAGVDRSWHLDIEPFAEIGYKKSIPSYRINIANLASSNWIGEKTPEFLHKDYLPGLRTNVQQRLEWQKLY